MAAWWGLFTPLGLARVVTPFAFLRFGKGRLAPGASVPRPSGGKRTTEWPRGAGPPCAPTRFRPEFSALKGRRPSQQTLGAWRKVRDLPTQGPRDPYTLSRRAPRLTGHLPGRKQCDSHTQGCYALRGFEPRPSSGRIASLAENLRLARRTALPATEVQARPLVWPVVLHGGDGAS